MIRTATRGSWEIRLAGKDCEALLNTTSAAKYRPGFCWRVIWPGSENWRRRTLSWTVGFFLALTAPAYPDETETATRDVSVTTDTNVPSWVQPLLERFQDSVVAITVEGREGRQVGMGTGFVVSKDGLVATNLHVIGEARPIKVKFRDGQEYSVTEVYASDRHLD